MAYSLWRDDQDRQTYAEMQIAATFIAAGAKGVELPNVVDRRNEFDALLNAPAERREPSKADIREALGLSRAG